MLGDFYQSSQKAGVLQRGRSDTDKVNQSESVTTNFLQTIRIIRTGHPLKRRTVRSSKKILCKWWPFVAREATQCVTTIFVNYPDRLYWLAFSQRRTSFCKWSWSSESKVDDIGGVDNHQEEQQEGEVVGLRSWEEMSTDHRRSDARYSSYIMHRSLLHTLYQTQFMNQILLAVHFFFGQHRSFQDTQQLWQYHINTAAKSFNVTKSRRFIVKTILMYCKCSPNAMVLSSVRCGIARLWSLATCIVGLWL